TYAGHPVCAAVAKRALELYDERGALENVRTLAPKFAAHIKALSAHPLVGHGRAIGLLGALEMVADKSTRAAFSPPGSKGAQVMQAAVETGLIVRALGDTVALCPPLIINEDELDDLFARLKQALDACLD
ncbi:MAG: aminotransferase class III-fold pyridoxal phosphate-dependent enzyme, partial [Alphaproteobacteria bacterium]|nr:aminotransferase class III-fold pyridoxal phosphate-dependent enzyme [Alphaproteobacteria bacterium]